MTSPVITTAAETADHALQIEAIHAAAFGPGRYARAAFRIREGGPHDRSLSRVALCGDKVVASVWMTPVVIGDAPALLLGPLAVAPSHMNQGIGRKILRESMALAKAAGHHLVLLVGDEPYYGPLGFAPVLPHGLFRFPAPVDQKRILIAELTPEALNGVGGDVRHANRFNAPRATT